MKQFSCGDVVPGCARTFSAADDDGILAQVAAHAASDHDLVDIPHEVVVQVRERILTV